MPPSPEEGLSPGPPPRGGRLWVSRPPSGQVAAGGRIQGTGHRVCPIPTPVTGVCACPALPPSCHRCARAIPAAQVTVPLQPCSGPPSPLCPVPHPEPSMLFRPLHATLKSLLRPHSHPAPPLGGSQLHPPPPPPRMRGRNFQASSPNWAAGNMLATPPSGSTFWATMSSDSDHSCFPA